MVTRRGLMQAAIGLPLVAATLESQPVAEANSRLELLALLGAAAGFAEAVATPGWDSVITPLLRPLRRTPAARTLARARQAGLPFVALPSLAAHLRGPPEHPELRTALTPWPQALHPGWQGVDLARFLQALGHAASSVRFSALWQANADFVAAAAEGVGARIVPADLDWLERWTGLHLPGAVRVTVGLGLGPGPWVVRRGGAEPEVWVIVAPSDTPGTTLFESEAGLIWERWFDDHHDVLLTPAERLYGAVRTRMDGLGLHSGRAVATASLVHAAAGVHLAQTKGQMFGSMRSAQALDLGFPWTSMLVDALGTYTTNRERFPTLDDFADTLAAAFSVIAAEEESRAKHRPNVLRVDPALGTDVDPSLTTISVTFDREMVATSWSLVGEPASRPPLDNPRFDASGRVFTVDTRLESGRRYVLSLNGPGERGFRSVEGVFLDPTVLEWNTR